MLQHVGWSRRLSCKKTPRPAIQESGLVVAWASVTNRSYAVERSSSMAAPPAFVVIQGGIGGQAGTTSYVDAEPNLSGSSYYRVKVEN